MKQFNKHTKLFLSLILLVVAVLCVVNVTYAYFSSTSKTSGEAVLKDLNVQFVYQANSEDSYQANENEATIELFSADGPIERGVPFNLSLTSGGDAINMLGIMSAVNDPMPSYVRFWIDAYVVNQDGTLNTTTNYGKYFIPSGDNVSLNSNSSSSSSWCYYATLTGMVTSLIGSRLTLTDLQGSPVPASLLGEKLKIFISFEAIQGANNAYLQEFDDEKGYCLDWQ